MAIDPGRNDPTTTRMRVVSWAIFLGLLGFIVLTDRANLDNLGLLTGGVLVLTFRELGGWVKK